LADFNLFDLLAGSAAVAGAVLADDADFFGALGLHGERVVRMDGWGEGG
jgi:hypothetical protein